MDAIEEDNARHADPAYPEYYGSKINREQLYNGMLLQFEDDQPEGHHSAAFFAREDEVAADLAQKEKSEAAAAIHKEIATSMAEPAQTEQSLATFRNPSVDLNEMYTGLVQLSDHDNDEDDIVPELTEAVAIQREHAKFEPRRKDYAGAEYDEDY